MATAEQRNHATSFLKKAEEYQASAEDNLEAGRYTPAAGDEIQPGISAKDAIVTALTGSTSKGKDHATASKELARALSERRRGRPKRILPGARNGGKVPSFCRVAMRSSRVRIPDPAHDLVFRWS